MSYLIKRIEELEKAEERLSTLKRIINEELGGFIEAWDNNPQTMLPANHEAKINAVRRVVAIAQKENIQ